MSRRCATRSVRRRAGRGDLREKGWVPLRRFALWWFLLLLGDLVFYVVLTPIWLGPAGGRMDRRAALTRAPLTRFGSSR